MSEDEPYYADYEGKMGENLCEILEEQIDSITVDFLDTCGIIGLDSLDISGLWWCYQNSAGELITLDVTDL